MAEEDAKSAKSKFKSKWHRVFKEKEEHELNTHHTNSLKLQDDVADFLKPSTDNANASAENVRHDTQVPRLNTSIAQRWPSTSEVRAAVAGDPSANATAIRGDDTPNGYRKPKRRKGLEVGFVRSEPEIIGEGGDDCEDPACIVARSKPPAEARPRAATYGAGVPAGYVDDGTRPNGQASSAQLDVGDSGQVSTTLRRVETAPDESWPQIDRQTIPAVQEASRANDEVFVSEHFLPGSEDHMDLGRPISIDDRPPQLPRLSRIPTGSSSHSGVHFGALQFDRDEPQVPTIQTPSIDGPDGQLASTSATLVETLPSISRSQDLWQTRKRELASGEGMILRRASALIKDPEADGSQQREDMGLGMRPSAQQYDMLSRPDAPSLMPEVPSTPCSAVEPMSTMSPTGPSPFADPKYLKQDAHQAAPGSTTGPASEPLMSIPTVQPPFRTPSAMAAIPVEEPQQDPSEDRALPARLQTKSAQHFGSSQPPPPLVTTQPPEITYKRPSHGQEELDEQLSATRLDSESDSRRVSPSGTSKYFVRSPNSAKSSRDPSPRAAYTRYDSAGSARALAMSVGEKEQSANISSSGYNGVTSSRSSSRQSTSPRASHSAGSDVPGHPILRGQEPINSLNGPNPRSSMYGQPPAARSSTNLSPNDYIAKGARPPTTRPAARNGEDNVHRSPNVDRPVFTEGHHDSPVEHSAPTTPASGRRQQSRWSTLYFDDSSPSTRSPGALEGLRGSSVERAQTTDVASRSRSGSAHMQPQSTSTSAPYDPDSSGRRPSRSRQASSYSNSAAEAAYVDFATRVANMRGVFRLTAEKQRPSDRCTPLDWLRTALWWYLNGKSAAEASLRRRPQTPDGLQREMLSQHHVDLAKTWWILSEPLAVYEIPVELTPTNALPNGQHSDEELRSSIMILKNRMKSLLLSIERSQNMPPSQSLIQGQDTLIWLDYPMAPVNAAPLLSNGFVPREQLQGLPISPLDALPVGDTDETFSYGRFPVDLLLDPRDVHARQSSIPCVLSMLRGKQDLGTTIVIASQSDVVNLKVSPWKGANNILTWYDVSWKDAPRAMTIRLHRNYEVTVRMQETSFRSLWNLLKYAERIEDHLRSEKDEKLIHEAQVAEVQYADSAGSKEFPSEKIRGARALVFERSAVVLDRVGERKIHRGYRLALVTDPQNKSLACVSHDVCKREPLFFEFMVDAAAPGTAAMLVRIPEESKRCKILLVFTDIRARQDLYDALCGIAVGPDGTILGKMVLTGMNLELATQTGGVMQAVPAALRALKWQRLGITSRFSDLPNGRQSSTVRSDSLRIVARHAAGCFTDRLNLSQGELLVRLPCEALPVIQILRNAQDDLSMAIDSRNLDPNIADGLTQLDQLMRQHATVRTYSFATYDDLHAFQSAITGCTVRYDGPVATLSIARRRSLVPIHKKWEASRARVQILQRDSTVQVLAFTEDFSHTDALCFQVSSTDVIETSKGDGKGKKWSSKFADAKFSLPRIPENGNNEGAPPEGGLARIRRRFLDIESLEHAEEHDDITVGFDTQEERDRFTQALPAQVTTGRNVMLNMKRRT